MFLRRFDTWIGVCLLVLAATGATGAVQSSQVAPISVSLRIEESTTVEQRATGTMALSIVNQSGEAITDLKLALEQPASASLGDDGVVVGSVAVDGVANVKAPFTADADFVSSGEQFVLRAAFRNAAGQNAEIRVSARLLSGGGL